ncbi:MAG: hypothetical protein KAI45_10395, partial [Melioribacteraceae bacterium]|nr:hypothetical protein [Melioribacteraceae bacterium]
MLKVRTFIFIVFSLFYFFNGELYSQISGTRTIRVGELWETDEDIPSGGWQNGYNWPGNHIRTKYNSEDLSGQGEIMLANGTARMAGMSCGIKDWTDRRGNHFPVAIYGTSESITTHNYTTVTGAPIWMKVILRREPPVVTVDGVVNNPRHEYDEIDPDLICDAKLEIRWATAFGITFQQDYYAYAAKSADSYMFVDFHALNNGNTDRNENDTPELKDQVLHDVYFNYMIQPIIGFEGCQQNGRVVEGSTDDWVEYYGENYLDFIGGGTPNNPSGDISADSLRLMMVWDGDALDDDYDDTGDPNNNTYWALPRPVKGTFLSPQYFGMGVSHADMTVDDTQNDLTQPVASSWTIAPKMERMLTIEQAYDYVFAGDGTTFGENWTKHKPSPQELGVIDPINKQELSRPNPYIAVGPYQMPFGSEVNWTLLVAVNGLSKEKCSEYGRLWYEGRQGVAGGITDAEKNAYLATGRDSLFKVFSTATRRYFNNIESNIERFNMPDAPPSPDLTITAKHKEVLVEWGDVSNELDPDTKVNDFSGYRVYRTQGIVDSTYVKVFECGGTSGIAVTNSFKDTTVQRGFGYYYYVTAFDDGTQNWETGKSMESGKYWNM